MTIKLGITGGIGSGKTVVSNLLNVMGIPVYFSDIEAKKLTATDPYIREQLIALVGDRVFENGQLNKPFLASYLFSSPAHAREVNRIIHPRVKTHFKEWVNENSSHRIVAMEAAILIESGFKDEVDYIVMVYSPLETRIQRAIERDNSNRELILERVRNQMDDEDKKAYADYIIVNDAKTPLIPQVEKLINELYSVLNH